MNGLTGHSLSLLNFDPVILRTLGHGHYRVIDRDPREVGLQSVDFGRLELVPNPNGQALCPGPKLEYLKTRTDLIPLGGWFCYALWTEPKKVKLNLLREQGVQFLQIPGWTIAFPNGRPRILYVDCRDGGEWRIGGWSLDHPSPGFSACYVH